VPVARLTLRNVRKTFGEAVALDDVTFSVSAGRSTLSSARMAQQEHVDERARGRDAFRLG